VHRHGARVLRDKGDAPRRVQVFCDAGLACVVYDNRGFGASDTGRGQVRQEIDPWVQVRDYQHAIT
jgi:alpha-beta hydrolase superfamily lysophospholipase